MVIKTRPSDFVGFEMKESVKLVSKTEICVITTLYDDNIFASSNKK